VTHEHRAAGGPIVLPSCRFSAATKSDTDPSMSVLFCHRSTESRVVDATYFGAVLIQVANG
jgi:hypothetical protein